MNHTFVFPGEAGPHSTDYGGMIGWVDLCWIVTYLDGLPARRCHPHLHQPDARWLTSYPVLRAYQLLLAVNLNPLHRRCSMLLNAKLCMLDAEIHYLITSWKVKRLEKGSEEKDFGVVVSNDLKVSKQCSQPYAKAIKLLGAINRTTVYKSTDILLQLHMSLVRPHLEYCTSAWSPHWNKGKQLLERIQHRFTRMLPGMKKLPHSQRLWNVGLWSVEARRYRPDLIMESLRSTLTVWIGWIWMHSTALIKITEKKDQHRFTSAFLLWDDCQYMELAGRWISIFQFTECVQKWSSSTMEECQWVSYSLLTCDPRRLSRFPWWRLYLVS